MKNPYTRPTEGIIKYANGKGLALKGKDRSKARKRKKGRK